ncbi:MAG TPA: 3'-5' exonuclease [Chloroflexota bacterium]|nr:3'-5' exonuclease [Chloroflexota bacterium]
MSAADRGFSGSPSSLLEHDLVFLDCEMTGGDPDRHDIIEIGAVRSRLPELAVLAELSVKVAPRTTRGSNQTSIRIARYSAKEWKSAIQIDEALRQLRQFADAAMFVGWATYNDLLFVRAAAERCGVEGLVGDAYLELQDWAQARLHIARTPGLQSVADQLKVVRDQEHSAIEDAFVSYEVFRILWRFSQEELDEIVPTLDWNSYAQLAGPVILEPDALSTRLAELAGYVVRGTSREQLISRRGTFRRD